MRQFLDITSTPELFFAILPADWQEAIVPYWEDYTGHTCIYILTEDQEIGCGGIVFEKTPPDMNHFRSEAEQWFGKGYLYLGFIWVPENARKQNKGSLWLRELKNTHPEQRYWLTTEEKELAGFYLKNDFEKIKTLHYGMLEEELFSYTP